MVDNRTMGRAADPRWASRAPRARRLAAGLALACTLLPAATAHAAVSYVGEYDAKDGGFGGTKFAAVVPAATQANDLMVVAVRDNINAPSAPAGWTLLHSQNSDKSRVFWKIAGASDAGTTVNFTFSLASYSGILAVFRGADTTAPFDRSDQGADTMGSITNVPIPGTGGAVARNGSMRFAVSSSGTVSAGSFSAPSATVIGSNSGIVSSGASYEAINAGTLASRSHVWNSAGGASLATSDVVQPPPCAAGGLNLSAPGAVSFGTAGLTGADATKTTTATVTVDDERGAPGAGWNLALTSTTFTTGSRTLPTTATTLTGVTPTAVAGRCSAPTNAIGYPLTVPAASVAPAASKIFDAAVGTGTGGTDLALALSLALPANAYTGAYTSTWTFTLSSGP